MLYNNNAFKDFDTEIKMKIEFVDLKRQLYGDPIVVTKGIINEIIENIDAFIKNTAFTMGDFLEKFEKEFTEYCNTQYCVGLNSGTDALEFALRCNNIIEGNVITVPNSYFTTASSINQAGLVPRFVDVDRETFNLDTIQLEAAIDKNTKAIIPVHLYGRPANMSEILKIAEKHNLIVIEDCCHAPGARFDSKKVPISGTGCFSFFPGKNLGSFGDGGALVTNDHEVEKKARMWRNDGSLEKYHHEILGRKARLHSLQAAILSVKLKHLDEWNKKRIENAAYYNEKLKDIKEIQLPLSSSDRIEPVFHLYTILTDKRDQLENYLKQNGISVGIHYPVPIHLQPAYSYLGLKKGSFPVTEKLAETELSLPMFPELRKDEIDFVCEKIKDFFLKA